jgi:predicted NAD-dependent protein-ADP-ribosyltransferase YbiA (DUF1768 family)
MIEQVEVPDGKDLWTYFTESELTQDYIECYSSFVPIEYELDGNGEPTDVEKYTKRERARQFVTTQLDKIFEKWQERNNRIADRKAGKIKSGGIS